MLTFSFCSIAHRWKPAAWLLATIFLCHHSALAQPAQNEALRLYADAANLQNRGAFEAASEDWGKFLKQFPKHELTPKAQYYLGVCQLQLKQFPAASASFDVVVKNHPQEPFIQEAYLNLGWCHYSQANARKPETFAKASEVFRQMAKQFPKGKFTDQALYFLGEAEYNQGRRDQAAEAYQRMVEDFPQSSLRCEALYALGVTQEELKKHDQAGKTYDAFLESCPDSKLFDEVRMRKAETLVQGDKLQDALAIFEELAGKEGFASAAHALYRQAYCLGQLNQDEKAGQAYWALTQEFPNSDYVDGAVIASGRSYYRAEKYAPAARAFEKAVADAGENLPEAAHWLARIRLRENQPQAALKIAEQAIPQAQQNVFLPQLQLDRADAMYELPGSKEKSIGAYLQLVEQNPGHNLAPQALYNAAFTALELQKYADGWKYSQTFLTNHPQDALKPDVQYVAAECQLYQNQHAQAEAIYRELLTAQPKREEASLWRLRLGLCMYLQKKYGETIQLLGDASQFPLADMKAEAHFLAGAGHFYQKRPQEAVKALSASLEAAPKWRQADETTLFLSRAQHAAGNLNEAIGTVRALLEQFPQSQQLAHAHYRLGEYHYEQKDFPKAAASYRQSAEKWPKSNFAPFAWNGLGWSSLKNNQYQAGEEAFSSLLSAHPQHQLTVDARLARAMCRRQLKNYDGAVADIDEFLKSNPPQGRRSDALYERGLAEAADAKYQQAADTFGKLLEEHPKYPNADKVLYEQAWAYQSTTPKQIDKAVSCFTRLTQAHANSPLAGEAFFHIGEDRYSKQRYQEAARAYQSAQSFNPQGELAEKVAYKLGWAHFETGDHQAALKQFDMQLQAAPQGELRHDGSFMKAECLFRQEKFKEAWPLYQAAVKAPLSSKPLSALALLHGGQSAAQSGSWDEAITLLEKLTEDHADSPYVAEAYYELGWSRQKIKQTEKAMADYEQAAQKSRSAVGVRARFMMGELLFQEKKHSEAIRQFQRAMYNYGVGNSTPEIRRWQAKSGYEAGRCAEVQIKGASPASQTKWVDEAKRYYQYVVKDHPKDDLAKSAQARLDELAKIR